MSEQGTRAHHRLVLVADDDEAIRSLLVEAIGQEPGLHALAAADGAQALARFEQTRPALALVDVNLPGLDGIEVIERLRAAEQTAHLPVIAMSAGGNRGRALEAGADVFVEKPFELDGLIGIVHECLSG